MRHTPCIGVYTRGKRSRGIQSPEYQELSAAAAATPLITLKSSETQNVDLTDKVRVNHYLRHFERRSALHATERNTTNSNGNQLFETFWSPQ
jgi:hypothetical protein